MHCCACLLHIVDRHLPVAVATPVLQVPEEGKFSERVWQCWDDIAYFGITTWAARSVRDSPTTHGELAAFDLVNNRLLWRRTVSE